MKETMSQQPIPFKDPVFVKGVKYLVYADITYVREYYEKTDDNDMGFFVPTTKKYRDETLLIGVVDHETDIEHIMKKPINTTKFDWQIHTHRVYAKTITHFYEEL
tara:strand:- start:1367 stop:1681 length:315 start_codon:yes stop_codon:yes gene_type:complete